MSFLTLRSFAKLITVNLNNVRCSSYKSSISLDKIYPQSVDPKEFTPPVSNDGKFSGYIPTQDLKITYMRSSGPGGQHVNKTETKVDIRFHLKNAKWLNEDTKQKLEDKYYTRINKEGYFIIRSEKTKCKMLNTADALNYLREIIFNLEKPEPTVKKETLEKLRKNKEKATRERLMEKRYRSLMKAQKKITI